MSEVRALARGLAILDAMLEAARDSDGGRPLAVSELAARLGVNKSSASRLVATMARRGYLERDPASRGYLLGPRLRLAVQERGPRALRELARPFLYLLMKRSGECAHTAVLVHGQALIIDDVESAASLRVAGGVGRLNLLHCTAVGKSLLAFTDADPPEELPARTARTITDHDLLARHLETVRSQGYAFDDEENEPGVRCLAAPVLDRDGSAVACIGISGPTVRMTEERIAQWAELVLDAARELSQAYGHAPPRSDQPAPIRAA